MLRLLGLIFMMPQEYRNRILLEESGYRILCLGESTTAGPYPSYLADILNEQNSDVHFTVFNEGIGGTDTAMILAQLERNIDNYKPHMIISMLGINDTKETPKFKENLKMKIILIFKNLRVYKLIVLLKEHILYKFSHIFMKLEFSQSDYAILGWQYLLEGHYKESEEMLIKALEYDPKNDVVLTELGAVYFHWKKYDKAILCYTKAKEINEDNDRAYAGLYLCFRAQGNIKKAMEYLQKTRTIRSQGYNEGTLYNYNKLKQIVLQKGIKLICVQYPLREVKLLKGLLMPNDGVVFVDNEDIFKKAIENASYEEYFRDNFAGDFGHCTDKGNRLLAHNIANAIIGECLNDIKRKNILE